MNLLTKSTSFYIVLFLVIINTACKKNNVKKIRPNVIIIYTDDQGAIDLNCYGAKDLETPNMDKLVQSGIKFSSFYAAPICGPSRAGLMTGKVPQRTGMLENDKGAGDMEHSGMPTEEYTMAEMFKNAGYNTALLGKWHLGYTKERQPGEQGFDYWFGHLVGCMDNYSHYFYWNGANRHVLYRNGKEVFYPGQYFPDLMVKEASAFIDKNKEQPFFLYFAMNTPHYPYQGTPEWLKYYQDKGVVYPRDLYAAFISTMDDKIGELLNKLEKEGLRENTIIIFQSDNGYSTEKRAHCGGGTAGNLRGSKFSLFEGGIRVPAAISWPGKLKAGETREQMASNCDWMPTLAELCGIDLDTSDLDGRSLVPLLEDNNLESRHSDGFCWKFQEQWVARKGDWKLLGNPKIMGEEFTYGDSLFLVNLNKDPGEKNNLSLKYPEKVDELLKQYKKWQERNYESNKKTYEISASK